MSNKRVLIVGGGFAGARVAQDLVKAGVGDVTLIDRKDYFEVTYATLRGVVENSDLDKRSRRRYSEFIKGKFVQGEVQSLDKDSALLVDGSRCSFDYAVVASGSSYQTFPIAKSQDAVAIDQRELEMSSWRQGLESANTILIIGGGAVGVEFAGEIAYRYPEKSVTLAEGGPRLLGELSEKASDVAKKQLQALGVKVLLNAMLQSEDTVVAEADVVYRCLGLKPNTSLMQAHFASLLDEHQRIRVDSHLRVQGVENIFAIGDCANVPEGKLGFLADMQGVAAASNIVRTINGKKLKPYKPSPMTALVPTGPKTGLVQLPFAVTTLGFMVNMKQKDLFISKQFKNLGV